MMTPLSRIVDTLAADLMVTQGGALLAIILAWNLIIFPLRHKKDLHIWAKQNDRSITSDYYKCNFDSKYVTSII